MLGQEQVAGSSRVFEGRSLRLRVDQVVKPDGSRTTREVVEHVNVVVLLPLDREGRILMVRQYRHAVERVLLELPAGGIDPGETPEQAAGRELREETGCAPGRLERLGGFYAAPGYLTEYLHFFRATELERSPLTAEDTDEIEVVPVRPSDIQAMVSSGQICDSKSLAALRLAGL